jgi:CRISPR-associated protein Csm3
MGLKLLEHHTIEKILKCKTGLRIGGSKDDMEVGGVEHPVLRDPLTKLPYIPGSSLKGKMRSLLEYKYDKVTSKGDPCGCGKSDCLVCKVFGPYKNVNHDLGPTRLIVRDAHLTEESRKDLERLRAEEGLLYAEAKPENIINRSTGVAATRGLRTQERIPAGTRFRLRLSIRIFHGDVKTKLIDFVNEGLKLLQEDYLGGSGTRGYGEIELEEPERGASSDANV